jgi:hypothetical protein
MQNWVNQILLSEIIKSIMWSYIRNCDNVASTMWHCQKSNQAPTAREPVFQRLYCEALFRVRRSVCDLTCIRIHYYSSVIGLLYFYPILFCDSLITWVSLSRNKSVFTVTFTWIIRLAEKEITSLLTKMKHFGAIVLSTWAAVTDGTIRT